MKTQNFNLAGKSIVITGATSGIGLAAAAEFTRQGAFVIGVGRSETRNLRAKETIKNNNPSGQIDYLLADLGNPQQVRNLGKAVHTLIGERGSNHLDVLINNAGVFLDKKRLNEDQIEMTFAVNHLAPFVLTHDLLPLLKQSQIGRVITLTSYVHRTTPINLKRISNPWPYIGLLAYKRSKLCNVLFTVELNRRYQDIRAFTVDPGVVNTSIGSKSRPGIISWARKKSLLKGTGPGVPVKTLLFLADHTISDPIEGVYFRDCQSKTPSRTAMRKDLAQSLWALSCQLTGTEWV